MCVPIQRRVGGQRLYWRVRTEGQRLRKANRTECWLDIISFCLSDDSGTLHPHALCLRSSPFVLTNIQPHITSTIFWQHGSEGKRKSRRVGRRPTSVYGDNRKEERIQQHDLGAACLCSMGLIVIMIYFLMSSAALPSALQSPDWIWRSISMLKRPSFIYELLTDSGYHLCNCSVYWSQRETEKEREWRRRGELKKDREGGIRF